MNLDSVCENFRWHATQTAVWCLEHISAVDPKSSLRTSILQGHSEEWQLHLNEYVFCNTGWSTLVTDLVLRRKKALRVTDLTTVSMSNVIKEGRFLIFRPTLSNHNGASQDESSGYLDYVDAPPWDTWVCWTDSYKRTEKYVQNDYLGCVISWTPPIFIDIVQRGIDVNATNCIEWAPDLDAAFNL